MDEFKPGDVVKFKSGGPLMTVSHVFQDAGQVFANCVWLLNGSARHGKGTFAVITLQKV